ncbi:MAG: aminotransferase class V-fold PLP-dependent enzyme [Saprospiraceae bacterium]|nr:aminotransferase class V-fold PLP-dependent enzyme [Saprospiraceae bacterium]
MSSRRSFIRQSAAFLGSFALHQQIGAAFPGISSREFQPSVHDAQGDDEEFWRQIRQAYAASPNMINLNNGGVSPTPRATMDALDYYNRMCSEAPSYYMWRILDQNREPLRENLAQLAGVSAEELAINRNATEALNTIVFGLPLKSGDEVVLSKYDYPNMMNAWKQREKRDGIKLVWVDLDLPSEDADYLANAYTSKFTSRTRLVHITHVINWNGQILPARAIADKAHAQGIEVLVDAAHSFALLDYKIPDLGADYWGTSLHKFLCGPYGSGLMWIKKEKIPNIWPLLSNDKPDGGDIRKFETLGTRSFPIEMAIGYSLDLHNLIGSRRKQERLHFLKNYWMEQVRDVKGIKLYTSLHPKWGCAIGVFGLEGQKAGDISSKLFEKHKIHTVPIEWEKINGVRVTPNVYTNKEDLDKLVRGIRGLAAG